MRGLGKCLTQENKEDGCHRNVKASRKRGKVSVRDVESHNGGLGAGYLYGCVHMRWILKVGNTYVLALPVLSVFCFYFSYSIFLFLFVLLILCYGTDPACLRTSHLHFLFNANHL